jgi:lipid A 4'-phosphatase
MYKRHKLWALPLLLLFAITPFLSFIDISIAKIAFFSKDPIAGGFFSTPFFDWIYRYGVVPSHIVCAVASICLLLSIWISSLCGLRKACFCLVLTLGLGSGLITHSILKEFWGRPRPRQITEFGGAQQFRPYWQPLFKSSQEPSRSFPSGHSTCGFFFFSFYFIARRYQIKWLAKCSFLVSLILGGLLSIARIIQGGHFTSDVLIAAIIMWETAYWMDYLFFEYSIKRNIPQKNAF